MSFLSKQSIDQIPADLLESKRVLIRVDFNVSIDKTTSKVGNNQRIVAALPTINYVIEKKAKAVVLMSHLGRPNGQQKKQFSLEPVAEELSGLLNKKVQFVNDCVGDEVERRCAQIIADTTEGCAIILLENLRFHPEEEGKGKDDNGKKITPSKESVQAFRQSLSKLGDVYVNDAFGTAHRAHSSMVGINSPVKVAGFLLKKEIDFLRVMENPTKPSLFILGGANVKDNYQILLNLLDRFDNIAIGGGMMFTFANILENMKIGATNIGKDGDTAKMVDDIMAKAKEKKVEIHFPVDFVVGDSTESTAKTKICTIDSGIEEQWSGLDIGPETAQKYASIIKTCKTVAWNGRMEVFEWKKCSEGTKVMMNALVKATESNECASIIGGGDTGKCCTGKFFNVEDKLSHVSTGGGASLEYLEGKVLPGIAALNNLNNL